MRNQLSPSLEISGACASVGRKHVGRVSVHWPFPQKEKQLLPGLSHQVSVLRKTLSHTVMPGCEDRAITHTIPSVPPLWTEVLSVPEGAQGRWARHPC